MQTRNQDGRAEWVREALATHERGLVSYAARITGEAERARDAVQETFLELCAQDPSRLDVQLREWLFTVCRNKALDMRRRESRMNTTSQVDDDRQAGREPEPAAALEREETLSEVLASVRELPEQQQEALVLKFRHGLSYREISRVTGHSLSNVGYLIHMGVKALRAKHAEGLQGGYAS